MPLHDIEDRYSAAAAMSLTEERANNTQLCQTRAEAVQKSNQHVASTAMDNFSDTTTEVMMENDGTSTSVLLPVLLGRSEAYSDAVRNACQNAQPVATHSKQVERLRTAVRTILESIGENPDREGLVDTPSRFAEAMLFLTQGYHLNVDEICRGAIFKEGHGRMIIVKDIDVHSLCEHHLLPFNGKVCSLHIRCTLISYCAIM